MKGRTSMKTGLGVATAVVVGGGAIGAVVALGGNSGTPAAQSAGYVLRYHHTMSAGQALSTAINQWSHSHHQQALTTLAQMKQMRGFTQARQHGTTFAAQAGVVVMATPQFMLVQSANNPGGTLHLWWLQQGTTQFANVTSNGAGLVAMSGGNNNAAFQAMQHGNMAPMQAAMAGSSRMAKQLAAPVTRTTTYKVQTGTTTITITITRTSTRVSSTGTGGHHGMTPPATPPASSSAPASPPASSSAPMTPPATSTGMTTPPATSTGMATPPTSVPPTTQPVFTTVNGVVKGDLVFIAGQRVHGQLVAQLVLFATTTTMATPPATTTTTPPATSTVTPPATSSVPPTQPTNTVSMGTHQ